jgi:hypothetical protein
MRAFIMVAAMALVIPFQAVGDPARADRLIDVTRLTEVLGVMREEGLSYAESLEADLFPGQGGRAWMGEADRIHALERSLADMRGSLTETLGKDTIDPAIAFFASPLGQKIVAAELSARAAMLDEEVDAIASEALAEKIAENDPRLDALRRFVDVNDLIESNVVGGLNSNLAFYRGLVDGGAFEGDITESQMLAEVWEQEADLRISSEEWLLSYLGLAYSALNDAELEAYIEMSDTEAGGAFNRAIFEAFDVLFNRTSYELGKAAARFMTAEDA